MSASLQTIVMRLATKIKRTKTRYLVYQFNWADMVFRIPLGMLVITALMLVTSIKKILTRTGKETSVIQILIMMELRMKKITAS